MADEKIAGDLKALNIPEILPIIPLINVVVFPKMILPFEVFEANSLALVDEAMATNRLMGLVLSKKNPLEMEAACPDNPGPTEEKFSSV